MYVTQVTDDDVRVICAVATPRVQAVECWRVSGLGERLLQVSEFTQVLRVMYLLSIFIFFVLLLRPLCVCAPGGVVVPPASLWSGASHTHTRRQGQRGILLIHVT